MKAMILAAGHGKRMGSLTVNTPKPLLKVNGQTLLENKLLAVKNAGIDDVVINVAYLGEQIQEFAGDGSRWRLNIRYSQEPEPLETAGGISRALPLLGEQPFIAINADIWCDYPLRNLLECRLPAPMLGHLVLVENPEQHAQGDFKLNSNGLIVETNDSNAGPSLTYSGIALYHPDLIKNYPHRRTAFPLLEVYQYAIAEQQLSGECYTGKWYDIGTPDRLAAINCLA